MSYLLVKDYMSKTPPSIPSNMLVSDVIEKLIENRFGGAPVVNDNNEIIGFVSEHDCISKILQSSYYCDPDASVNEVMSTDIETLRPSDSIVDLAQKMLASKRQLFQVTENNKLIGIINRSMVLTALKENFQKCGRG
jgi:DeoR family transcriptional regulator, catabolite repression regulator